MLYYPCRYLSLLSMVSLLAYYDSSQKPDLEVSRSVLTVYHALQYLQYIDVLAMPGPHMHQPSTSTVHLSSKRSLSVKPGRVHPFARFRAQHSRDSNVRLAAALINVVVHVLTGPQMHPVQEQVHLLVHATRFARHVGPPSLQYVRST